MNDQQKRFVERYAIHGNGAKAAVEAGYKRSNAADTAHDLKQNPEIMAAIRERQLELSMSDAEAQKRVSDMARTRLNDYLKEETVWETSWEKVPLKTLISELQLEIDIDSEYVDRAGLTEEEQDKVFDLNKQREREIIRLEIELEKNPKAFRVRKTQPQAVKKVGVDLSKLAKADEEGAIKKFSFNERGLPSVEMYSADSALETMLKLHGKLINRHDHTNNGKSFGDFLMETNE